jgi:hypothetical protein
MAHDSEEGVRRMKLIMAALGPITGDTFDERRREALRRFDMAHGITPEDVAEMDRQRAERIASLTDDERAQVAEIEAEVENIHAAMDEMKRDNPTIQ